MAIELGVVPVSAPLRAVFRLGEILVELLPDHAAEWTPAGAPVLPRSFVVELERERSVILPNDALVLAALAVPLLVRACGLSRTGLVSADGRERPPLGPAWRTIAWCDPITAAPPDPHPNAAALAVGARPATRDGDPRIRVYDDGSREIATTTLAAFIRERLPGRYRHGVETWAAWTEAVRRVAAEGAREPRLPVVRIADDAPVPAPATAIRCTHAKFGAGMIVRLDGDKAEVRFDSGVTKLLARAYLRE